MPAYYADPKSLPISSWLSRSQEEAPRPQVRLSLTPNNYADYATPNSPRSPLRSMNSGRMNFGPVRSRPGSGTRRKHRKHRKATRKHRR